MTALRSACRRQVLEGEEIELLGDAAQAVADHERRARPARRRSTNYQSAGGFDRPDRAGLEERRFVAGDAAGVGCWGGVCDTADGSGAECFTVPEGRVKATMPPPIRRYNSSTSCWV
jgi:hypothetical protein